jgi:hypothetical protein
MQSKGHRATQTSQLRTCIELRRLHVKRSRLPLRRPRRLASQVHACCIPLLAFLASYFPLYLRADGTAVIVRPCGVSACERKTETVRKLCVHIMAPWLLESTTPLSALLRHSCDVSLSHEGYCFWQSQELPVSDVLSTTYTRKGLQNIVDIVDPTAGLHNTPPA